MRAKYGYTITTTPGLIDEGTFPVSLDGFDSGNFYPAQLGSPVFDNVPVWETAAMAESAMIAKLPEGVSPAAYAGLEVAAVYDVAPGFLAYGFVYSHNGFDVPEM